MAGDPGSVDSDQNFIVDSSLFISNFSDQASYVLGDETYIFNDYKIHFGSARRSFNLSREWSNWKELPSINRNGQILTYTENEVILGLDQNNHCPRRN